MSYPDPLSEWRETVSTAFAHLSQPQATVLALWSYGMVLARSCGLTVVSATLAVQMGCGDGQPGPALARMVLCRRQQTRSPPS